MTVREHMVMGIEAQAWRYLGVKQAVARDTVGYSPARYAQVLMSLIDRPDVEREYPSLTRRLRRLRDSRRQARRPRSGWAS